MQSYYFGIPHPLHRIAAGEHLTGKQLTPMLSMSQPGQYAALLFGRELEQGSEQALADDWSRQGVTQRGDGGQHLRGQREEGQDLRDPGAGDAEPASEGGPRRARAVVQRPLPVPRHGDRVAVWPWSVHRSRCCSRPWGWGGALDVVRRQPGAARRGAGARTGEDC